MNNPKQNNLIVNLKSLLILTGAAFFLIQCSTGSNYTSAPDIEPGEVQMDEKEWLELRIGDMPLVISAPHGGTLNPEEIRDRNCKGAVTVRDRNVNELAFEVEKELKEQYGMQPSIIAAHIARRKIDLNRDIDVATCGNEEMVQTWNKYHEYIETALEKAIDEFGSVIYIDLHGHGHDKQRLELGYLLNKAELSDIHNDPNGNNNLAEESSLWNLLSRNGKLALGDLMTGDKAFGTLMQNADIAAVPSLNDPYPLKDDAFFNGGYNTRRYTSDDYPEVFGWQIEAHYRGARDDEGRPAFAKAFANAITIYMEEYLENQ